MDKREWKEFQDSGLLWMVNATLHLFGWAIVVVKNNGVISEVYPARVGFRGFDEATNTRGYQKVSQYMVDNANELLKESKE